MCGVVFSRGVELEGLGTAGGVVVAGGVVEECVPSAVGVPAASGVGIKRLNAAT